MRYILPLLSLLLLTAQAKSTPLPLHKLRTYVNSGQAAKFEPVQPDEKAPQGRFRILADASKSAYRLQAYCHVPAGSNEVQRYTLRLTASNDVSSTGNLSLTLKPKNQKYAWNGSFSRVASKQLPLIPGVHQLTVEVDLSQQTIPDLGFVCPVINVTGLTSGTVTLAQLELETRPSVNTPPKAAPEPAGPGLPGFLPQANALTRFEWKGRIRLSKFRLMMDFTTLGLDIATLSPANQAVAWQWPEGDTILAEHKQNEWAISAGESPDKLAPVCVISGNTIQAAAGAEGVVFRNSKNEDRFVSGGLNMIGRSLLVKKGCPAVKTRPIPVIDQALAIFCIEEAERALRDVQKLYKANEALIRQSWSGNDNSRPWSTAFAFHFSKLAQRKAKLMKETEQFLPALLAQDTVRDRYAQLVYVGVLRYFEKEDHWGNHFYNRYYEMLDGQPEVQAAFQFTRKAEQLVSRARRVEKASFAEGVTAEGLPLSAGFTSSLTHVFRRAGSPSKLFPKMSLDMAAGETESVQLVLSTAQKRVDAINVRCRALTPDAPTVRLRFTEYICLMSEPNAQLPLTLGGDVEMPDILKHYEAGTPFAMEAYCNQPIQIDISSGNAAKPGIYEYAVELHEGGKKVASLPLSVRVRAFSLGEETIPTLGGWRKGGIQSWYGENAKTARRNLMKAMLEHRLQPVDLYAFSPEEEDLAWAIQQGLQCVNLGRGSLESMAYPEPDMPSFIELYASKDGKRFERIPSEARFERRKIPCGLEEHDLIVVPKASLASYKFLKIHNSEIRDSTRAVPVQKFFLLSANYGPAVQLTSPDSTTQTPAQFFAMRQDLAPAFNGPDKMRPVREFWMDNLRIKENLGSILFEKANSEVTAIRLRNYCIQRTHADIMKKYNLVRSTPGGDKVQMYLYGFDESREHLNGRILSAFENVKKSLPKDILILTTAAETINTPDIYKHMDILCPANAFAYPRVNERMHKKYGTAFWTYVGGGGYYPMANFERVDQPLIFARAFPWEMIAYDYVNGMLYWDYHMWRFNRRLKDSDEIDWSRWNPTHSTNNGMGAIFYPGPKGEIFPSRRATAIRDGLEDVLAYRLAKRLVTAKPAAKHPELLARLASIRSGFCTGMSSFCKDIGRMDAHRKALYDFIEELKEK